MSYSTCTANSDSIGSIVQISRSLLSIERVTDLYTGCNAPVFQNQRSHCLQRHESACGALQFDEVFKPSLHPYDLLCSYGIWVSKGGRVGALDNSQTGRLLGGERMDHL